MSVIGYYITCDDAICEECAPADFEDGDYSEWRGFEDWSEPIAILSDTESDTPTHCAECESLIGHALTSDGYEYVAEHIANAARDDGGRRCITRQWWERYGSELYGRQLPQIVGAMISTWPERDKFSPSN